MAPPANANGAVIVQRSSAFLRSEDLSLREVFKPEASAFLVPIFPIFPKSVFLRQFLELGRNRQLPALVAIGRQLLEPHHRVGELREIVGAAQREGFTLDVTLELIVSDHAGSAALPSRHAYTE